MKYYQYKLTCPYNSRKFRKQLTLNQTFFLCHILFTDLWSVLQTLFNIHIFSIYFVFIYRIAYGNLPKWIVDGVPIRGLNIPNYTHLNQVSSINVWNQFVKVWLWGRTLDLFRIPHILYFTPVKSSNIHCLFFFPFRLNHWRTCKV